MILEFNFSRRMSFKKSHPLAFGCRTCLWVGFSVYLLSGAIIIYYYSSNGEISSNIRKLGYELIPKHLQPKFPLFCFFLAKFLRSSSVLFTLIFIFPLLSPISTKSQMVCFHIQQSNVPVTLIEEGEKKEQPALYLAGKKKRPTRFQFGPAVSDLSSAVRYS